MDDRTPAQLYALIFGAVLVIAGIIGFFYSSSFGSPGHTDGVFGVLDVNGWHNIVHIASGAIGLAVVSSVPRARAYALGLAVVYTIVAIWGFIIGDGDAILTIVPVNTEDNVLHALIALAGYGAYAASAPRPGTATPRTA